MRAREVANPSATELSAAEQDLVIVRRHYVPPAPLPTTTKPIDPAAPEGRPADQRGRVPDSRRGTRKQHRGMQ